MALYDDLVKLIEKRQEELKNYQGAELFQKNRGTASYEKSVGCFLSHGSGFSECDEKQEGRVRLFP